MRTPLTLRAYRLTTSLASPLSGWWLDRRLSRGREDSERLGERYGLSPAPRPEGALVWIHGASVGEAFSLDPVVRRLVSDGRACVMTTGTVTSAKLLESRLPAGARHQYAPLDAPGPMRKFFAHWRPDLGLIAESEIWPNMIMEAARARVPLGLVNARLSERSFARWKRAPKLIGALLGRFEFCLAQTPLDAERWHALGAPNVSVAGNLKYDASAPPVEREEFAVLSGALAGRKIWVAASTHPGEELIAAQAQRRVEQDVPEALTIIAPRHAARGPHIREELAARGFAVELRSEGATLGARSRIYVADTMGELGLFYRLAGLVFMGKSLCGEGGQNPIEPAKLGSALLHGPMVGNFRDVYDALDAEGGALSVADGADLARRLIGLFNDAAAQRRMARAALKCVEARAGASERVIAAAAPWLPAPVP